MSLFNISENNSNSYYNEQDNIFISDKGPYLLISRSHLMLSKIKLKENRLRHQLSDNISFQLNTELKEQIPELSIFESDHIKSYSNGWNCSNQIRKQNLYETIWCKIERHEQPDLFVTIGNVVFKCHSAILSCYTNYFPILNHQNRFEFKKDNHMTAIVFMKFYKWMLEENVIIGESDVLHLLCAAEVLNVGELRNQCWIVLDNSAVYTESLAYELYRGAKQYGIQSIQQLMLPRIWKFFLTVLSEEDFLKMETDEICQWLRANTIGVNSEMEVFYAAVLWVNSKWIDRKGKPLRKVMNCVRFGLLPPWFLVSLHTVKHDYDVDRVVKDAKVKKLITDGLSLTTAILFYSKNTEELEEFLHRGNLKIPMQRKWIVDVSCPYHYYEGSQKLQHVCYENFVEYLQHLRSGNRNHWMNVRPASENHWSFVFNQRPNSMTLKLN